MGHHLVAILRIAIACFEEIAKRVCALAGVVFPFVLKGGTFVAATETADVADFFCLEIGGEVVVELLLCARTEAGGAVADEDFFPFVLLL